MIRFLIALALTCLAPPAFARCVTAEDLRAGGIVIEEPDGYALHFPDVGPNLVSAAEVGLFGPTRLFLLAYGTHPFFRVRIESAAPVLDDGAVHYLPLPLDDVPAPEPGLTRDITYSKTYHYNGTAQVSSETFVQTWASATENLTVGDGTYEVLRGRTRYVYENDPDGDWAEDLVIYFTDLGISYMIGWNEPGLETPDVFDIAVIRPADG